MHTIYLLKYSVQGKTLRKSTVYDVAMTTYIPGRTEKLC